MSSSSARINSRTKHNAPVALVGSPVSETSVWWVASALIAASLLLPAIAKAQASGGARVRISAPSANSCLRLSSTPSTLSHSPEGMAMVKMMAELDAMSQGAAMRPDGLPPETRRQIIVLRSSVDSVARVYTGTGETTAGGRLTEALPRMVVGQRMEPSEVERMMVTNRLRELQPQVAELARMQEQTVVGSVTMQLNTLGYVGLTASAGTFPMEVDPMKPFAYCEYPRVESVEPGSPADKAGLLAGDTLIAYNNRDLRAFDVNYPEIMIPGKPLVIKYRRDGVMRNASTVVARRPPEVRRFSGRVMGACTEAEALAGCQSQTVTVRGLPFGPPTPGGNVVTMRAVRPVLMSDGNGGGVLLGATVRVIDDQLAQSLAVEAGVLVLEVPINNPAYDSGLRNGDLIVSANGTSVKDLQTLDRVLRVRQAERLADLQVSNKATGSRKVTLRW